MQDEIGRVIDANLNRLREGIRVIEDTLRYLHNDTSLALSCKNLRHQLKFPAQTQLLQYRNTRTDVAKKSTQSELERQHLSALVLANFKRAQESARVLEEYTKLAADFGDTAVFKNARYTLYELEKMYFEKYGEMGGGSNKK